jgi:DNA-binding GntR family transcriptional regulator
VTGKDRTVNANLYFEILRKIVKGEFQPGQRLVEEELALEFQVSRTPIREILFKLERDGLVQRLRNQGARVTAFTPDDVEQLYEIRKALECLGVRSAAKNLKLIDLLEFERRMEISSPSKDADFLQKQLELDVEFHKLLMSHSGNRRLVAYLDNLSMLIHSVRLLSYGSEEHALAANDDHLAVVRALLRRDADLAERLLGKHIEASKQLALASFLEKNKGNKRLKRTHHEKQIRAKQRGNAERDGIQSAKVKLER